MQERNSDIRIYQLDDPATWVDNEKKILKLVLKSANIRHGLNLLSNISFNINPVCGWISYSRDNLLWSNTQKQALPLTANDVDKICRKFISDLSNLSSEKNFIKDQIPPLLPLSSSFNCSLNSAKLVPHPNIGTIDHWLMKYVFKVRKTNELDDFVEVFGADITIRVGNNGEIIAFNSKWRPTFLKFEYDSSIDIVVNEDSSGEHTHDADVHKKPEIIYDLTGENSIQNYLLPYYIHRDKGHFEFAPASAKSFMISIQQDFTLDGFRRIVLSIEGGSGQFEYAIYQWKPDEIWDEGQVLLKSGFYRKDSPVELSLPKAVYTILIIAIDFETGIIRKQEYSVYSFPIFNEVNDILV